MAVKDELTLDPSELQQAGQAALADSKQLESELAIEEPASTLDDGDIEVESDFWDTDEPFGVTKEDIEQEQTDEVEESTDELVSEDEVSEVGAPTTFTYKANGEEVEFKLDEQGIEELKQKLPLLDGARKAFSDKAKVQRKFKQAQAELEEYKPYKANWDKLEAIRDDHAKAFEIITGKNYEEFIAAEVEKRDQYRNASEEERRVLDYENELARVKSLHEKERQKREAQAKQIEDRMYQTEKADMQSKLRREYEKYEVPVSDNPATTSRIKKMLWQSSVDDIKAYQQRYGKLTQKMIEKAFKENASALKSAYNTAVDKKVEEVSTQKRESATKRAQAAATRNYDGKVERELTKLDPLTLFNRAVRGFKSK